MSTRKLDLSDKAFEKHCKWFEKHLRIRTKLATVTPLKLNRIQRELERYKWECFLQDKPCYVIILKARQEGCSTWAEATLFRDSREMKHRKTLVMAHKEDASRNIFEMTKRYYEHLPKQPETEKSSARSLKFTDTESEFQVETAGAGSGAGRSFTAQAIHLSELDFYQNPEEVMGALMQTLPDRGKICVIIESTANGPMLTMNELWDRATDGKNEFKPFFFSWFYHDEYSRELSFEDLRKYSPRDWSTKYKHWINKAEEEAKDGLARESRESSRGGPHAAGREQDSRGGPTPDRSDQERPKEENSPPGGQKGLKATDGDASGEDAGEGRSPRRYLPFHRREWQDARRDARSKAASGHGELPEAGLSDEERERRDRDPGFARVDPTDHGRPEGDIRERSYGVDSLMRDSLTDYEVSLIQEFGVTLQQINWLRFCLETKCNGDETRRRREYPSRPEEAFEASGADILDPRVLSQWYKEAETQGPEAKGSMIAREVAFDQIIVAFDDEDRGGKIEIYEYPDPHHRYVIGLDPSQGVDGGDWTVAFVMDVDSGDQVAEFRATIDPDLAVDQIEWLGIYYNRAYAIIEVNAGYGGPYVRHLADRNTLELYEQKRYDRTVRQFMKKPGFDTTTRTRPLLITEAKTSVRKEIAKIRSLETLKECRTLWENDVGKIEARPGHHDDGFFAYALCLIARNEILGIETMQQEEERKQASFLLQLNRKSRRLDKERKAKIRSRNVARTKHVRAHTTRPGGRRSVI